MKKVRETVSLLVLEQGAAWPTWGSSLRLDAPHVIVEAQNDFESDEEFVARVGQRLNRLIDHGTEIRSIGYVCAANEERSSDARLDLASRLLASLATERGSQLILGGGAWDLRGPEGRERDRLLSLWAQLSERAPGRRVTVRFDDEPHESGVFSVDRNAPPGTLVARG